MRGETVSVASKSYGVTDGLSFRRAHNSQEVYNVASMFVRFRRQDLKKGGVSLRAELCESYRDARKGDVPRNRYIAYLGSIREQDCSNPVAQAKFWRSVEARLARLRLSTDDETTVREKVQAQIPHKSWTDIIAYLSKFSRRSVGRL
jgi:hypothetical protein